MGLFFDQDWFDERLKAAGLSRAKMAQAAGMTADEVEMVFRDQRELEGFEVQAIARVLRADPREVASRSGATDMGLEQASHAIHPSEMLRAPRRSAEPEFVVTREVIAGLHERIDRLERLLEMVIAKLDRR
jgi:transcriptional regulator with XRE-family HTH domain